MHHVYVRLGCMHAQLYVVFACASVQYVHRLASCACVVYLCITRIYVCVCVRVVYIMRLFLRCVCVYCSSNNSSYRVTLNNFWWSSLKFSRGTNTVNKGIPPLFCLALCLSLPTTSIGRRHWWQGSAFPSNWPLVLDTDDFKGNNCWIKLTRMSNIIYRSINKHHLNYYFILLKTK